MGIVMPMRGPARNAGLIRRAMDNGDPQGEKGHRRGYMIMLE